MLANSRHQRTFIGSQCAVCEEPLEHMLRGERVLQLTCGHVSHEACFYEYIKEFEAENCPSCDAPLGFDTSRGGNIDFQNLNRLVRAAKASDFTDRHRDSQPTPQWDKEPARKVEQPSPASPKSPSRSREHLLPDDVISSGRRHDRHTNGRALHGRNNSHDSTVNTASPIPEKPPSGDFGEPQPSTGRRHDFDVQSMESSLGSPRLHTRNPIPAPNVTVRSEFPTITKARNQQSLTCLVTVEVVEGKWQLYPDDVRSPTQPRSIAAEMAQPPKPERQAPAAPAELEQPVNRALKDSRALEEAKADLIGRVDNWHRLDFSRFGELILHSPVRVGKDRRTWQELDCYLFTETLICVKDKKTSSADRQTWDGSEEPNKAKGRSILKGLILIKKHLQQVEVVHDAHILTLSLSVAELPTFHLAFGDHDQFELWRRALINIQQPEAQDPARSEVDHSAARSDDELSNGIARDDRRPSSIHSSSNGGPRSQGTAPTEYSNPRTPGLELQSSVSSMHVPLDIVVVVPVSSSTQGLKINLLRDALRFLVSNLGERDRMGLVTFGSAGGGVPVVGMTSKHWGGWSKALESVRPVGPKSMRADLVEGANVALDLLMQRRSANPLSHILLISDAATSEPESVNFVVSRAEAAKISIHSFGLGLTHKPDIMVELSTRTKASYTYIKDWMMLRECVAGCLGSLQSTSHQNVKLKLRLPEGSPARFVKINGALSVTKRASGRDAEASLGDLRFGDKRDILVQLAIQPENVSTESLPSDPWEHMISGLEALGPIDQDEVRHISVEEMPLLQADLSWGDILREGSNAQMHRPSLLAITMLPASQRKISVARPITPPIPPHPSVVQRRMELLTSDMLSRALGLVARGQHDRAQHLLSETRSILKGLGKGGLPPLPTPPPERALPPTPPAPQTPRIGELKGSPTDPPLTALPLPPSSQPIRRTPSPSHIDGLHPFAPAVGIDSITMTALDTELESALEWIAHPAVFSRDSRKAVLQAISVISSQRALTYRTPAESLWAGRVPGIRRVMQQSREWRDIDDSLREE